jgi:hypothetical protein
MLILEREFIKWGSPRQTPNQVNDGSVEDGCATYGLHKILKFDIRVKNVGDEELVIGSRYNNNLFMDSVVHGRIFKFPFFKYRLHNPQIEFVNLKHPWCLTDNPDDCDFQKIGKNKADMYAKDHQCQFIVIDGISDGGYIFEATVNLFSLELLREDPHNPLIIHETNYDDNTIEIPVNITGFDIH